MVEGWGVVGRTFTLHKMTEAVNLIDLVDVTGDSIVRSAIGYRTHMTGYNLIIYADEKTFISRSHNKTYGSRELIKIAKNFKQEDLK